MDFHNNPDGGGISEGRRDIRGEAEIGGEGGGQVMNCTHSGLRKIVLV